MMMNSDVSSLADLEFVPYINQEGLIPNFVQGKIGIYAVFDAERVLKFVGYSRDIYVSLKQHLVRQPGYCYWLKIQTIDRPNRTILETIRDQWIAENGTLPAGNGPEASKWNDPIDVKVMMTVEEQASYDNPVNDEVTQEKILKNVARRVEAEILTALKSRGVTEEIRFNPKLKTSGLLDLK